jgi:hypothetical protein
MDMKIEIMLSVVGDLGGNLDGWKEQINIIMQYWFILDAFYKMDSGCQMELDY